MKACSVCGIRKAGRHFAKDGKGKVTEVCKKCAEGSEVKTETTKAPPPPVVAPPAKPRASLEIPSGLGFRAAIEGDTLQLEQDRDADDGERYTHSLSLNRVEAQRFLDWITKIVEPEPA